MSTWFSVMKTRGFSSGLECLVVDAVKGHSLIGDEALKQVSIEGEQV